MPDLAALLQSLDRCEHGRHRCDPCIGCGGGLSVGNQVLRPGTHLGWTVRGERIIVPHPSRITDPDAWVEPIPGCHLAGTPQETARA